MFLFFEIETKGSCLNKIVITFLKHQELFNGTVLAREAIKK